MSNTLAEKQEPLELMDIVDENDQVVGTMLRSEVYKNFPLHRIVHVMVFNKEGEFGLQKRSMEKSHKPGYWTTPVSGHPHAGETYEEASSREAEEEIGAKLVLNNFRKIVYKDNERRGLHRFLGVFESQFDGPFKLNPEEVSAFEFFDRNHLQNMIDDKDLFHPELLFILNEFYGFEI